MNVHVSVGQKEEDKSQVLHNWPRRPHLEPFLKIFKLIYFHAKSVFKSTEREPVHLEIPDYCEVVRPVDLCVSIRSNMLSIQTKIIGNKVLSHIHKRTRTCFLKVINRYNFHLKYQYHFGSHLNSPLLDNN